MVDDSFPVVFSVVQFVFPIENLLEVESELVPSFLAYPEPGRGGSGHDGLEIVNSCSGRRGGRCRRDELSARGKVYTIEVEVFSSTVYN